LQLDACAAEYCFGVQLPVLSKRSPRVFDAIRALACCQLSFFLTTRDADILQSAELTRSVVASIGSDVYSNSEEAIGAWALLVICELMPRSVIDWHRCLKERINVLSSLNIHGLLPGIRGSVSWVILRLGLFLLFIILAYLDSLEASIDRECAANSLNRHCELLIL